MGLFGFGTPKTKADYAKRIAREERLLADLKASLATLKERQSILDRKAAIERQKGSIAALKAEMKAAPKD